MASTGETRDAEYQRCLWALGRGCVVEARTMGSVRCDLRRQTR